MFLKEDPDLVLRRRYRSILDVCGKGAILFSLWSVIKGLMYVFLGDNLLRQFHDRVETSGISMPFFIVSFVTVIVIGLAMRLTVAKMALDEAKGKKTGVFSLLLAFLLIFSSLYGIYSLFLDAEIRAYYTLADRIVTAFVELTSIFNLSEIIFYSLKLRSLPDPKETEAD